ncbi:hypothetical protein [Pseudonocardia sp. 73-21]|uniref:hypothetical protein n=1 Tax=Pseudonocardia sp. 73-21 TaxID=1895809 RepID=UPI00095E1992|nr:hypothetical protein [Pseudonocardia sp. 73-21]OJY53536.1 MAG: hypothetical protein BGP03_17530 [Pseudonocardia sp. 73-21]
MTARDNHNTAWNRLNDLRAQIGQMWSRVDSGGDVDLDALATTERQADALERQIPRLQAAARTELEAEQVEEYHRVAAAEREVYRANTADLAAAYLEADKAMQNLAEVAARHAHHIDRYMMIPRPESVLQGVTHGVRGAVLQMGGHADRMHEIDPGDVVLAVAGRALEAVPGKPWPMYAMDFRRIRNDLPPIIPTNGA